MLLRCLFGAIGMPTYFYGLKYIPTSFGAIIVNISPILVSILAFFILHEQFTKFKIFTVFGSFGGVLLFVLGKDSKTPEYNEFFFGLLCSSICCVMISFVVSSIFVRIVNKHVHYTLSPFYFGLMTCTEALLFLIFIPSVYHFEHYTPYGVVLFLTSGAFNYMGQTLRSAALKFEDASVIVPFNYLQVIYLFAADLIIFSYSFSETDILGATK